MNQEILLYVVAFASLLKETKTVTTGEDLLLQRTLICSCPNCSGSIADFFLRASDSCRTCVLNCLSSTWEIDEEMSARHPEVRCLRDITTTLDLYGHITESMRVTSHEAGHHAGQDIQETSD